MHLWVRRAPFKVAPVAPSKGGHMYQDNCYTSSDSSSRLGEDCNFTYSIRGPVVEGNGTQRGGIIVLGAWKFGRA